VFFLPHPANTNPLPHHAASNDFQAAPWGTSSSGGLSFFPVTQWLVIAGAGIYLIGADRKSNPPAYVDIIAKHSSGLACPGREPMTVGGCLKVLGAVLFAPFLVTHNDKGLLLHGLWLRDVGSSIGKPAGSGSLPFWIGSPSFSMRFDVYEFRHQRWCSACLNLSGSSS